MQAALWSGAGACAALAVAAGIAEHRRTRRRHLDRVGWVPWNAVQILAAFLAIAAAALAIKT
jgi:hypothetical protein